MNRERMQVIAGLLEDAVREEMARREPPSMTAGFTFELGLAIGEMRADPDVLTHQDLTGWADPKQVAAYEGRLRILGDQLAAAEPLLVHVASWRSTTAVPLPTVTEWHAVLDERDVLREQLASDLMARDELQRQLRVALDEISTLTAVPVPTVEQGEGTTEGAKEVSAPGRGSAPAAESPGSTSSAPLEPGTPNQEEAPAAVQELRPAPSPASTDDGKVACPKCSRQVGLSRWGKVSWHNTPDGRSCRRTGTQITDRTPDMTVGPQVPRQPGEELSERIRRLDTPANDAAGCKHGAVTDGIAEPCTHEPDHDGPHSWESRRPKLESASTPRTVSA